MNDTEVVIAGAGPVAILDRSVLPEDGPALLGVTQSRVESVLNGHSEQLGAEIR